MLASAAPVSQASDIFALGVTLFEIAERIMPFSGCNDVSEAILSGRRPKFSEVEDLVQTSESIAVCERESRTRFATLVAQLWSQHPAARPLAVEAVSSLLEIRTDYILQLEEIKQDHRKAVLSPTFSLRKPLLNGVAKVVVNDMSALSEEHNSITQSQEVAKVLFIEPSISEGNVLDEQLPLPGQVTHKRKMGVKFKDEA